MKCDTFDKLDEYHQALKDWEISKLAVRQLEDRLALAKELRVSRAQYVGRLESKMKEASRIAIEDDPVTRVRLRALADKSI